MKFENKILPFCFTIVPVLKVIFLFSLPFSLSFAQINTIYRTDSMLLFQKDTIPPLVLLDDYFSVSGKNVSIGFFGSGNFNKHNDNNILLGEELSGLQFINGTGLGVSGGFFSEVRITDYFDIQVRFILENKSGIMRTDYLIPVFNDKLAKTEHDLNIYLEYLSVDLLIKYNILSNLYIVTGPSIGKPITSDYSHKVKIISDEISYENEVIEKEFDKKLITNVQNKYSFKFGLGYAIPFIWSSLFLIPEINYEYQFSRIILDSEWKIKNIYGMIILRYDL